MAACRVCGCDLNFAEGVGAAIYNGICKSCRTQLRESAEDTEAHMRETQKEIAEEAKLRDRISSVLLTTETAPNLNITERLDLVSAQAAFEINNFKDVLVGFMNPVKGRSNELEKQLDQLKRDSTERLKEKAHELGGNAVVAVDLDLSTVTVGNISLMMMMASGTAVILEEEADHA